MKTLLKLALTLAALWFAFHHIAWEELKATLRTGSPAYLCAASFALLLQACGGGLRWHAVRRALGTRDPAWRTALLYYASNFFNLLFTSTLGGDMARVWLAKHSGDETKNALHGVVIDRILSLAGLAVLVSITLPLLFPYLGLDGTLGIAASVGCGLLGLAGFALLGVFLPALQRVRLRLAQEAATALTLVIHKYSVLLRALFWAVCAHVLYATAAYFLAQSLGISLGWFACVTLVPLVLFVSTLPISLGGWGVREMGMIGLLGLAGIENAQALALSVQLGLLGMLVNGLGGLYYLRLKHWK